MRAFHEPSHVEIQQAKSKQEMARARPKSRAESLVRNSLFKSVILQDLVPAAVGPDLDSTWSSRITARCLAVGHKPLCYLLSVVMERFRRGKDFPGNKHSLILSRSDLRQQENIQLEMSAAQVEMVWRRQWGRENRWWPCLCAQVSALGLGEKRDMSNLSLQYQRRQWAKQEKSQWIVRVLIVGPSRDE